MTKKEKSFENTRKLHKNSKKKFSNEKSIYDLKKKYLSKILIKFIRMEKLALTFKMSLHRS